MTHEHTSLNAAIGYAAASGKPVAAAVHVDTGTLHYGGAIHTAKHAGLPVMIMAGGPPVSIPVDARLARSRRTSVDAAGVRPERHRAQLCEVDHRLEYQIIRD